jgi:hypothetical protein
VAARIPSVEIADHCDTHAIRRPDSKARACHAIYRDNVRTECFRKLEMTSLVEKMQVNVAE